MLKKLIRIATTCGVLLAGYVGYTQAFSLLTRHVATPPDVPMLPYDPSPSRSSREASQLALDAFGPGHWASNAKLRFYESDRGFWIYADDYRRSENGKRFDFVPFALIWRDRNGKALKTITSREATVVFSQAPDMVRGNKSNEPSRVIEANMIVDVRIRDDKGTPSELGDDLTITIDDLHYNGKDDTISSDKRLVLEERDTLATGEGLSIELLASESTAHGSTNGYSGARSIRLLRDVRIAIQDVGSTGIVPGGASSSPSPSQRRPGEITCDGEMKIDLPLVRQQPLVGPPAPTEPTLAHFARNVRIRQGDPQSPEQIDCDQLHLTMVPASRPEQGSDPITESQNQLVSEGIPPEPDPNGTTKSPSAGGGPVSNLALQHARATGHAVWLQSKVYGLVAQGNELTYHRGATGENDVTYFRGDHGTETHHKNLTDGTEDVIQTVDITIHKYKDNKGSMEVVARGPGWLETRRLTDQVLLRSATWKEQLVVQPIKGDETRKLLTLDGSPELVDTRQGTLDATRKIVATLVSSPKQGEDPDQSLRPVSPEAGSSSTSNAFRIEQMQAWGTVHLISNGTLPAAETESGPAGVGSASRRTITAREWLGVVFEAPSEPVKSRTKTANTLAPNSPHLAPPVRIEHPGEPATPANSGTTTTLAEAPGPGDPAINVESDRIWAWLSPVLPANRESESSTPNPTPEVVDSDQKEKSGKWDLREVRLRGRVLVHQDAPPGKTRGLDVEGESIDVLNQGSKLYEVRAYGNGPQLARATTDEFLIEGPVIGLDQARNTACVIGAGQLVQNNAGTGILGNSMGDPVVIPTAMDQDPEYVHTVQPEKRSSPRGPLTIAWGRDSEGAPLKSPDGSPIDAWMKFYGKPASDRGGIEPARVQFHHGVRAWTRESVLRSSDMVAYFDGPIDFAKSSGMNRLSNSRTRTNSAVETNSPAQITRVVCEQAADVESRKFNDLGTLIEKRHVSGERLIYDRNSNRFHVDSPGIVELWDRNGKKNQSSGPRQRDPVMGVQTGTRVRPISDDPTRRPTIRRIAGQTRVIGGSNQIALAPLRLTRIWFEDQMIGQVDTTRKGSKRYPGQAEFFGNVRAISAEVSDENEVLDPDNLPMDYVYTVSETLRVISEPPLPGSPDDAPDRVFVQSWKDVSGNLGRQGRETTIFTSDHMDYNSETGVSYVYGDEKGVTIVDKASAGKPPSYGGGSVVMYNHLTGEHHISDVRGMQLIDPNSGIRTGIPPIPPETQKAKPKRSLPRTPLNNKERRNFNGGTR